MTGGVIKRQLKGARKAVRARSAVTGRFVSLADARRRPRTTVIERVRRRER